LYVNIIDKSIQINVTCIADKVLWNDKIYRIERSVWKNYIAPLFSK